MTGAILGVDNLHVHLGSGAWKSNNSFRVTTMHPLLATGAIGLTILAPETLGMISSGEFYTCHFISFYIMYT